MAAFQNPFAQGSRNDGQAYGSTGSYDSPILEDVGTCGIEWITERHVACVFLLDTSGSMASNDAIGKLNMGIRAFKEQTVNDPSFDEHTKACIDVAIISFGPDVQVQQDFTPVSNMEPPILTANGITPMGAAIDKALDMITAQKAKYNELGTPYYRPWIFCITDGCPTDDYKAAATRLQNMEEAKKVLGYCVGVDGFDRQRMAEIFSRGRMFALDNLNFPELFKFVSSSLATVRNSDASCGSNVQVEAPRDLHTISMDF